MNSTERRAKILEASQAYYTDGTSPLTDAEFDALLEEERKENPNSDLLDVGHGFDVNLVSGKKFPHKYGIVGSLPKCHNWSEFPKSLKGIKIATTLKLDGISCVMYYNNGLMYQALTRGTDGVGIDITDKVQKIVPNYFRIPNSEFTGAVRGEILMPYSEYEKFLAVHEDAKNPRNTTSGLIGMKEISEDLKYLRIIVYTVIGIESKQTYPFPLYPFSDYYSMHDWLVDNFGKDNVVHIGKDIFEDDKSFIKEMEFRRNIWYDEFPADGIVITSNDIKFESAAQGTAVEYEATAFKFPAETKITTITGIEWNLSKTKCLIPTILVEPVELSGATVSRAAGCNAKMVRDKYWGSYAKVKITRANEVIPYIEETIEPATPDFPYECPVCGAELVWEGVHLKCPNPDCSDMKIQDLLVWCNNIAPTDGLGDTLKIKFFEELHNNYIKDSFHKQFEISIEGVYDYNETIIAKGAQEKLFALMLYDLKHNEVSIVSALKALNIPRLGDATADLLSHYPEDISQLMQGEIPDNLAYKIGNANAESISRNIKKFARLNYIKSNLVYCDTSSNNSRIKVAITGSLSIARKDFEKLLNDNGFVLGDITKDTKYLITNELSSSSKSKKATAMNIPVISEEEFRSKYNI